MPLDKPIDLTLHDVEETRARLGERVLDTPVHHWRGPDLAAAVGSDIDVRIKLELFQVTGTFKARGAFNNMLALSPEARSRGVVAVSAGNHAIATAYAAQQEGLSAKVVMMTSASPVRVARCKQYGAEVIQTDTVHEAFELVERIQGDEGRSFVHPFDGRHTVLGTATCGFEFATQVPGLDAAIIPVGGGGLISGMAMAMKALSPRIEIYGVEPVGADSMTRSIAAGSPQKLEAVKTIADSLGAPFAMPFSFEVARRHVDEMVTIDDDAMRRAMALIYGELKMAVEPACAASTAALMGPLKARLAGKRVGLIACGSNMDIGTVAEHIARVTD